MTFASFKIPDLTFKELSSGRSGGATILQLQAALYSKNILLFRAILSSAISTGHPQASSVRKAYDLLSEIQRQDPASVRRVLTHPAVSVWLCETSRSLNTGNFFAGRCEPERALALAAAGAVRAGFDCSIDMITDDGTVTLPSLGRATLNARPESRFRVRMHVDRRKAQVRGGHRTVTLPSDLHTDTPGWQGLRLLRATTHGKRLELLLDDLDDYRLPGVSKMDRLGEAACARLQLSLADAWRILVRDHHETAAAIGGMIKVLTPLKASSGSQLSATFSQALGCTALTIPDDGLTMAVTLVHELQHTKLYSLTDIVVLTEDNPTNLYYAPWRDDPRPLDALLQGSYAHLGLTSFWWQRRRYTFGEERLRADIEFARWRSASLTATSVLLESGGLTPAGVAFASNMHATLSAYDNEPVPPCALTAAQDLIMDHRARWETSHGRTQSQRSTEST
ncbi:HEXXH motif domain-containing protein [Streptomyces caniscabiei]|uniref:HEXXH motif domain-containing protein n=1 Tax=Streptomyces caniscabiei TaxID=2746961 RepID=UPI0029ACBE29|nr:HEXXH motif domain-containing protein [Streptomyces caniscabiei]MDX3727255.1 HEXXH motif domain-containing protein [Streptomyces caniscabiei]